MGLVPPQLPNCRCLDLVDEGKTMKRCNYPEQPEPETFNISWEVGRSVVSKLLDFFGVSERSRAIPTGRNRQNELDIINNGCIASSGVASTTKKVVSKPKRELIF